MQPLLARLHRYAGLTMAAFLFLAGLTGSIIAFNTEIDRALNPGLMTTTTQGAVLSPDALVRHLHQALPGAQVLIVPVTVAPGDAAMLRLMPRDGKSNFDEAYLDPVTGKLLGVRSWGQCCFAPERLMPFLYKFHYSLALPGVWGLWLMGGIAILWALDCFTSFLRTLPPVFSWKQWKKAWVFKRGASGYRFTVDLHRVNGLWLWALLFMLAVSSVALVLPQQVFRPLVSVFSPLKPGFGEMMVRHPVRKDQPLIGFDRARDLAQSYFAQQHRDATVHQIMQYGGTYGALYTKAGHDGESGLGYSVLYLDAYDGRVAVDDRPDAGSNGDRFVALQYPLHSGRIAGLAGRISISLMGGVVAMLSVTGVLIWLKKRRKPKR